MHTDPLDMTGRTVIVTGATMGLGRVIATRFLEHGGDVVACPAGAAYGAAKAGLDSLTQTLAHEWGPAIRVLSVVVGLLRTEQAHLYYGDEAGIEAVGRTLALGRLGDPTEIADVVLFCASPLASFMSGASVPVHGGGEVPSYLLATTGEVARYRPGPKP